MPNQCKICGSYAINPEEHGREAGKDLDLCDVCYWRKRAQGPIVEHWDINGGPVITEYDFDGATVTATIEDVDGLFMAIEVIAEFEPAQPPRLRTKWDEIGQEGINASCEITSAMVAVADDQSLKVILTEEQKDEIAEVIMEKLTDAP